MTKWSEVDKSWLACAIDGEGSVGLRTVGTKREQYVRIQIANTDYQFMKKISKLTNTKITVRNHYEGHLGKKVIYWVTINKHKNVLTILELILPYLIIKKKKSKKIILFIKSRTWNKPRGVLN